MSRKLPHPHFDDGVIVADGGEIVVEDGGYVFLGEDVGGIADEH